MNREIRAHGEEQLEPDLLAWLVRTDHEPVTGWEPEPPLEDLRCHPDLVARLSEVARPVGATGRRFVAGCPVIHHPAGPPIAAAAGSALLIVRSDSPPGGIAAPWPRPAGLGPAWVGLDPWTVDIAFARGLDLLRAHVNTAYRLAEAGR